MGQTASADLAELTECVIDPPQNVSKESEQREVETLPKGEPLRLKEPSERLSKRKEPKLAMSIKLLKELEEAMLNTRRIQETLFAQNLYFVNSDVVQIQPSRKIELETLVCR